MSVLTFPRPAPGARRTVPGTRLTSVCVRGRARRLARLLLGLWLAAAATAGWAGEAEPAAADPQLEARVMALATELRCLVCQNQTIADSNAALAADLRGQIRERLRAGASDREVTEYMVARYGDFVLYRPPLRARTLLLWAGPALLLATALAAYFTHLARRGRGAPAAPLDEPEQARVRELLDAPRFGGEP
ncbi:MAG: cytochrome c-type biogenesis protein CcmH [Gammaproteobacteria bacterium]|nr:cytochrome c-type biogenesis protein CcmH [Gammaproteobacteria bacterium]MCG3146334.1 hypothetical protein [Gammaproteobacteria bacterium]